ncbi:DUF1150 family protein [Pelagibius sp. Alg239-R121]|uniref:DUF1150 family protein n=1 Tax=Pelagibius sp. Alg239-R121 TaxID=2993448 RepID=UPI0024A64D21|nr:DUF1150 family protein [Pelagibius sp. Alg239-R121]
MQNTLEFANSISTHDLRILGINEVAYIKPQESDGQVYYTIHAADGTEVARVPEREVAVVTVRQNNMEPASIH